MPPKAESSLLTDLPPGWLDSMVLARCMEAPCVIEYNGVPTRITVPLAAAVYRTAKVLHQVVFNQTRPRESGEPPALSVRCLADLSQPDSAKAQKLPLALALAEEAGSNIKLILGAMTRKPCDAQAWLDKVLGAAAGQVALRQPQLNPAVLHCITTIEFRGTPHRPLFLDTLLPSMIVQYCPSLQELLAGYVVMSATAATPQGTPCTKLHTLTLARITFADRVPSQAFTQQLTNLPSLTALHMIVLQPVNDGIHVSAIRRYSAQLKVFSFHTGGQLRQVPWRADMLFQRLEQLNLFTVSLHSDAQLQQLLATAPNVKYMSLHSISGLTTSFAQTPCSWEELVMTTVHVTDLATLPLSKCTRLVCVDHLGLTGVNGGKPTLEQIRAAVTTAAAVGGLRFDHKRSGSLGVTLSLCPDYPPELLTAAAPLLQYLTLSVTLRMPMTPGPQPPGQAASVNALLTTLGQHLKCRNALVSHDIWLCCPDALAQLPGLFPHVTRFRFYDQPPLDELIAMVHTANRAIELDIMCLPAADDTARALQATMQAAGHNHVTLVSQIAVKTLEGGPLVPDT